MELQKFLAGKPSGNDIADFSKRIENRYGIKTYQDVKNTYDWIAKALRKGDFADLRSHPQPQQDGHGNFAGDEAAHGSKKIE